MDTDLRRVMKVVRPRPWEFDPDRTARHYAGSVPPPKPKK